jgi:hypothetical protein
MLYRLKRHPIPIRAFFRHSLVLTYAFPKALLEPLLPPGLVLDTYGDFGFVAIALVQTEDLRPLFVPRALGRDFFLSGYRIFARFEPPNGRRLRGLRILRSDADSSLMVGFGNWLTHYAYRKAEVALAETPTSLEIQIRTAQAEADLHVLADLASQPAPLPAGSPFADLREARKFAGPLPFTFDYEKETHSLVLIEGVREHWDPQPVRVEVRLNTFFRQPPFSEASPILANSFHVSNIPYLWKRGVRVSLPRE